MACKRLGSPIILSYAFRFFVYPVQSVLPFILRRQTFSYIPSKTNISRDTEYTWVLGSYTWGWVYLGIAQLYLGLGITQSYLGLGISQLYLGLGIRQLYLGLGNRQLYMGLCNRQLYLGLDRLFIFSYICTTQSMQQSSNNLAFVTRSLILLFFI